VCPIEWLQLKRLSLPVVGEDVEQLELSFTSAGNIQWSSHFGNSFKGLEAWLKWLASSSNPKRKERRKERGGREGKTV
jgi:hypothetical protein